MIKLGARPGPRPSSRPPRAPAPSLEGSLDHARAEGDLRSMEQDVDVSAGDAEDRRDVLASTLLEQS